MPTAAMCSLASPMVKVPKWKIEAASTAEAWPSRDALDEMVERADAARGDHRHRHRVGDGAGQREVEAVAGAVAVHRGEQDLAGAERGDLDGIVDRVDAGRVAAAMGEDLPAAVVAGAAHLLGVDGDDDRLGAEFLRGLARRCAGRGPRRC